FQSNSIMSDAVFATSDALHRISLGNDNRMEMNTFHTGTKTWRKCRWGRIIESDPSISEESLSLPGTSHLPEAVVQQLVMLRRSTALEKAFPLSDSLLIARSPDNLLIVHNDKVRRVRRDATAPRVDFAFNLSNGSIIYGGVNMAKHACLQVQMASSIEELERQVSSLEGGIPLFRRYPSSSSDEGPFDYSKALFSLQDNRLTIVVPKMNKQGKSCLSILTYDISSGSIYESTQLLSSPLPFSFWSSRRFMANDQIVALIHHKLITVHIKTGIINSRDVDSSVTSFTISPSGQLFLISSSDVYSSSYLTAPLLSSLARDTVLNRLQYSFRSSIPLGTSDPMIVHTVLS
ncbi:hypothetical protein PRIPAC_71308, partial [Pristionchus pacificus]|uniref:Uncharacterized protein n=1 Tax=Pristionchus pacificus TaxID=54126 RepID=A0A2A6CR75_PRIPA